MNILGIVAIFQWKYYSTLHMFKATLFFLINEVEGLSPMNIVTSCLCSSKSRPVCCWQERLDRNKMFKIYLHSKYLLSSLATILCIKCFGMQVVIDL